MLFRTTLTEFQRRLLLSAIVSAGVFLLFTGCTLRSTTEMPPQSNLRSTVETYPSTQDSTIEPLLPVRKPQEPMRMLRTEALEWIQIYENRYGAGTTSIEIETADEIAVYNTQIIASCPTVVDMADVPESLTGEKLREMILRYTSPIGEHCDRDGQYISWEEKNGILTNRNIDAIEQTIPVKRAVITSRCDMKSLPTGLDFYNYGDKYYSQIQETELIVSTPVWVLHVSMDEKFFFVQARCYVGWVPAEAVAFCSDAQYSMFSEPTRFITMVQPYVNIHEVRVDMGATLPYQCEDMVSYHVYLPTRDDNGFLAFDEALVDKHDAAFGYLPYTMENYYNQAFAYLGTMYGWGGADGGVDCSGFICSVFNTFGIHLPRNTGEQKLYSGINHSLSSHSYTETTAIFEQIRDPASVHRPGHVMLYLGMRDSCPYVIHAPQGGEVVTVTSLSVPGNLQSVTILTGLEN